MSSTLIATTFSKTRRSCPEGVEILNRQKQSVKGFPSKYKFNSQQTLHPPLSPPRNRPQIPTPTPLPLSDQIKTNHFNDQRGGQQTVQHTNIQTDSHKKGQSNFFPSFLFFVLFLVEESILRSQLKSLTKIRSQPQGINPLAKIRPHPQGTHPTSSNIRWNNPSPKIRSHTQRWIHPTLLLRDSPRSNPTQIGASQRTHHIKIRTSKRWIQSSKIRTAHR